MNVQIAEAAAYERAENNLLSADPTAGKTLVNAVPKAE